MPVNHVLENVFGTIGAVLWSIQIIPQLVKSYRTKDTEGLSVGLMFIWAVASWFLGVYVIVQDLSIPIIIQPQSFGLLATISTLQCLYYNGYAPPKYGPISLKTCLLLFFGFMGGMGAFEVGMYYALRAGMNNGTDWPVLLFGIISAILLAGALLPQYYEIWKYKEVKGISLTFMLVDMAGGVFCVLSLAFRAEIDILGAINYGCVVVLDGIVLLLAWILNPRAERKRKQLEGDVESAEEGEVSNRTSMSMEETDGEQVHDRGAAASPAEGSTGKRSFEVIEGHGHPVREEVRHALRTVSREEGEESVAIDPVGAAIRHRA